MFRRSERLRSIRSVSDYDDLTATKQSDRTRQAKASRAQKHPTKAVKAKSNQAGHSETSQTCCKCSEVEPVDITDDVKVIQWLLCCECNKWWHAFCAKVKGEDAEKLETYSIPFVCAFCVLGISDNKSYSLLTGETTECKVNQDLSVVHEKLNKLIAVNAAQFESPLVDAASDKLGKSFKESQVVIIDKVSTPKTYKQSDKIIKELNKYSSISESCDLAYSLSQGGIAIHLKEDTDCEQFIQCWPEDIFGGGTVAHHPKKLSSSGKVSAFLRDIPPSISIQTVKNSLGGTKYKSIRRMRFYDSKKPMPIIKVTFQNSKDCETALSSNGIEISSIKRKILFSPERDFRVIRCFHCQRYGHISSCCDFDKRCVNCGESECNESECEKLPNCVNCGKGHKSSSSACPVFKEILKKRKLYSVFKS